MVRQYYSSRRGKRELTIDEFYRAVWELFNMFRGKDYFKQKTGLQTDYFPDAFQSEARVFLGFQPFPLKAWTSVEKTEDHLFDLIEFLFDRVSKPRGWAQFESAEGYSYSDYEEYGEAEGKDDFRKAANAILVDWKSGYELTEGGEVESRGTKGLQYLFAADIPIFDESNVDSKVRTAITKWRSRHSKVSDKKEAVRILADVFEYLKTAHQLEQAMDSKDSSTLFNIANNFAVRHHNPAQKTNYDPSIWLRGCSIFTSLPTTLRCECSLSVGLQRRLPSSPHPLWMTFAYSSPMLLTWGRCGEGWRGRTNRAHATPARSQSALRSSAPCGSPAMTSTIQALACSALSRTLAKMILKKVVGR